jgi:hypothetical protein
MLNDYMPVSSSKAPGYDIDYYVINNTEQFLILSEECCHYEYDILTCSTFILHQQQKLPDSFTYQDLSKKDHTMGRANY